LNFEHFVRPQTMHEASHRLSISRCHAHRINQMRIGLP